MANTAPATNFPYATNSSFGGVPLPGATSQGTLLGTGGTGGLGAALYGAVPGVYDPVISAGESIAGNLHNIKGNANLTQATDEISAAGAALPYQMNLPDYQNMLTTATGNTSAELGGQIPQDVINQIQQGAAERGVATGQGVNSENTNAAYLQALGLTSQNEMATGQSNLTYLIGETPTGAPYNPSSSFVTPEQEQAAYQAMMTNMAAPDPTASGIFSSIMSLL